MSSGALDQILLEDIAKCCPRQFLAYHQCMSLDKPDPAECKEQQLNLAACIKTGVPAFTTIQEKCGEKLVKYESCLRAKENDRSQCVNELYSLRDCATSSLGRK